MHFGDSKALQKDDVPIVTQIGVFRLIAEKNSTPEFISGLRIAYLFKRALALDPAVEACNAEIDATIRGRGIGPSIRLMTGAAIWVPCPIRAPPRRERPDQPGKLHFASSN
ncbi:hypothetical protein VNO77_04419 [Canavalia gladiata]|uniref:Uncharacterized protein n=1 Tax=Canavalia gladiata TaxID=3824 RepID=A0AAN9MWJ1_CANGL